MAFKFTKSRFLLCEGDDDKGFFETLIAQRNLPDFQVCHPAEICGTGGKTAFTPSLKGMETISGWAALEALLVVGDNDEATSFSDIQKCFTDNGHTAPLNSQTVGNMFGKPVAILMIPKATIVGDLETLCLPAIHERWPRAKRCVPFFLRCTGAVTLFGADKWPKRSSVSKARVRAATVGFNADDPYKGMGHLFRNGTLSVHNRCFDELVTFFQTFDAMCGI